MDEKFVYVSQQPVAGAEPALAEPRFVIEHEGKHYLTVAVWEYHAGEDASDAIQAGVGQVKALFDTHVDATPARVAAIPPLTGTLRAFEDSSPRPR